MRRPTLRIAVVGMLLALTSVALPATQAAAAGRVIHVDPSVNLQSAMSALRPGDMLVLAPGRYTMSQGGQAIHPTMTAGTASAPIVVTALEAADPPVLAGAMVLNRPTHWIFQYLTVQGTLATHPGIYINGGVGWTIRKSQIYGAAATQSFANVAVSNTAASGLPQHWQFVDNCVHDGGSGTASGHSPDTDHNLYVSASGNAPGLVARNVMYNATAGYNVKVGDGAGTAPAASNVHVLYNTFYNARRQVLVVGKETGDVIARNIMVKSTRPTLPSAAVFYGLTQRSSVAIAHNYNFAVTPSWYAFPTAGGAYVYDGGDDGVRSASPALSAPGCGMVAQNASARTYYGTKAASAATPVVP